MVNAHRAEAADVYIEDGVVVAVRPNIPVSARRASARLLRSQCSTWFEDGSHLQPCSWMPSGSGFLTLYFSMMEESIVYDRKKITQFTSLLSSTHRVIYSLLGR